jgi:hypothetical protein
MNKLNEMIKIADIHADRIQMALNELQYYFPFDALKVNTFNREQLLLTDLLVHRFGKLQDLLGNKIIDEFLIFNEESVDNLTMLDKIHRLERLEIIENAELWKKMREARNHAAHEYPDNPALVAEYLNEIVRLSSNLLTILDNIKKRITTQ